MWNLVVAAPKGGHHAGGQHPNQMPHEENPSAGKPIDASYSYPLPMGPAIPDKCNVM